MPEGPLNVFPDGALPAAYSPELVFFDRLAAFGERPALIDPAGVVLSYAALAARADAAAADFPDVPTLTLLTMRNDVDSVVLYLAALRHRHPVILAGDGAEAVIAAFRPWVPGTPHPAAAAVHPDLAVLLSTSGSTGSPKLVRLSRANIDANAASIVEYLGITPDDRAITSLPLHYSYGLSVLNSHLAAGAAVVLTDLPVNAPAFWQLFDAQGVTSIAGVPYSYELFDRIGVRERPLPSLKTMTQAGGRMPPDRVGAYARWAADRGIGFYVMYGQTEATARMAYLPPALAFDHQDCIGVAIPGGSFTIRPVEDGDGAGELVYRGPNVMMGYAEAADDLARGAELGELATGDLGERTAAGLYRITGRRSRFSKLFGLRISHDEIERWLASHGTTAVVTGDDLVLAVMTEAAAAPGRAAALAAHIGVPATSIAWMTGATPRLPSGKPDYGAVRRMALAGRAADGAGAAPDGIDAIFAAVFPGVIVGNDDSFTTLGGDSLSYVNFSMALEQVLGRAPEGWEAMTLAQLRARQGAIVPAMRGWRWIESDIVVRAAAICGIVTLHVGPGAGTADRVGIAGGAAVLMTLFGYNLARFQQDKLLSDDRLAVLSRFFVRIILPYYAILAGYLLVKRTPDFGSLLLVSNYRGRFGGALEPFWFLEATIQCLAFVVLLFAVPAVRRLARARPVAFAMALLAGAIIVKMIGARLLDQAFLQQRTFDATLVYVAMGWVAWTVQDRPGRLALYAMAIAVTIASWGVRDSHLAWMSLGLALVLFVPRLPVPRLLANLVVTIAMASFYIYLSHIFVIWAMKSKFAGPAPLTIVIAIAVGIGVAWLVQTLPSWRRVPGVR